MTPAVEELVRETIELTGAAQPALMDTDAPVLTDGALSTADRTYYLIGLIGGKDVGKSALVNALAGKNITATSSYGPGTEGVVAYAHVTQEKALRELLEREVPGQYRIVTHELPALRRQVLLDLPDIDSHFASHLQVTRRMLRHMLFPVWMVSVEKYADRQPQQMLAKVADGNAPNNFVFCLNKVDQLNSAKLKHSRLPADESSPWEPEPDAAAELRDDYAGRVQRTLSLESPPHVFMISATHPETFELPGLRDVLAREKSQEVVRHSQELAARRQDRSLMAWLDSQQLPIRAQRLAQLQHDAQELTTQRIAGPLLEEVIPRLLDDPSTRGAMAEEILTERVAYWPVVRLVHTLLSPVFVLMRGATARNSGPLQTPQGLIDVALKETGYSISDLVQTTFAQLRQSQPGMGELYSHQRLWEQMSADVSAGELRRSLGATIQRQRDFARKRLVRNHWVSAPLRWLLTFGAIIWFPFAQPILQAILGGANLHAWRREVAALAVEVLGVNYLLASAGFLVVYFAVLWLALRWNTQRKVARLMSSSRMMELRDDSLNLAAQTLAWLDGLIVPLRQGRERLESLIRRAEAIGIISDAPGSAEKKAKSA
jgi:GTPase Era involved in 16S rRNA processing